MCVRRKRPRHITYGIFPPRTDTNKHGVFKGFFREIPRGCMGRIAPIGGDCIFRVKVLEYYRQEPMDSFGMDLAASKAPSASRFHR